MRRLRVCARPSGHRTSEGVVPSPGLKRRRLVPTTRAGLGWILTAAGLLGTGTSPAADWTLVPGLRAGPITEKTSESDLRTIFGEANVVSSDIGVGEGFTEPGTILFPDDPGKRAEILWVRGDRTKIKILRITEKGTVWKTDRGVTIGTSLSTLRRINERPLTLLGFAWDYGGSIVDCNGGVLKELGTQADRGSAGRTLILRVSPGPEWRGTREYGSVKGDRDFSSDNPAMKKMNPTVYEMTLRFGPD